MNHAIIPREQTTGAAEPRLTPLEAFVAWLASFLRIIAGLKRRTVFPTNWKDHWEGLRELEWYRDQILAFSASHVLAGGSLDDRTDFQLIMEVPDLYGICPKTPHAMNRRFIAMGQFRIDPDKYIQRHIQRIARAAGIQLDHALRIAPLRHATKTSRATSRGFAEGGKQPCARLTQAPLASLSRHATGANGLSTEARRAQVEGGLAFGPRGPPPHSRLPTPHSLSAPAPETAPVCPIWTNAYKAPSSAP